MIKNRIRTAALAGAIAVATGVSGLAVPAMAQDTAVNVDGSVAVEVGAENVTETQLQELTDATEEYLQRGNGRAIEEIVAEYIAYAENGFDPSEEAAAGTFNAASEEAAAKLAASAENITAARASVAFALNADEVAESDWDGFRGSIDAAADELNPLIGALNGANDNHGTDGEGTDYFYLLDELATDVDGDPRPAPAYYDLLDLQAEVDRQYELSGQWAIDEDPASFVTRDHQTALDNLKAAVDVQVETVTEAYDRALASNREAQRSDVLVRQLFLERATAQRDSLRVVEAIFATVARYVELYENDELTEDSTLRAEYGAVLDDLWEGLNYNRGYLRDANAAAEEYYLSWESDYFNGGEDRVYAETKRGFALQTYEKIFANGQIWQNALSRVNLLDENIIAEREAERAAAERAEQEAREAAEREQAIADALKEIADNAGNNDDGDDNDDDNNNGGSSVGGLGIFAALAGVIGLIAAAFPFVSNFLNLNR